MRNRIEFRNPAMKQYDKKSGGMLPMVIVVVLLAFGARFLFGAEAQLPHAQLTRWFPAGGSEVLAMDCHPEENAEHFYCRVERTRNGSSVAVVVIDEMTASAALKHFFVQLPAHGPARSTASGRKSLTWTVTDANHQVSGEAIWRDPKMEQQTTAVLSLEGEIAAQLSR